MTNTPPKSWLYVPGSRPERFAKALASGAGGIILDLEDSVASDAKLQARGHVVQWLKQVDLNDKCIAVRINPPACIVGLEDILALTALPSGPYALVIPKVENPETVRHLSSVLSDVGSRTCLYALIESARGVSAVDAIAESDSRLEGLMFGAADYAAGLGLEATEFRAESARARLVNATGLGGLVAIDTPSFDLGEDNALQSICLASAEMGFFGKAAIHPRQIAVINEQFRPSEAKKLRAQRTLDASEGGVAMLDGKMIDTAMIRWARRIIG